MSAFMVGATVALAVGCSGAEPAGERTETSAPAAITFEEFEAKAFRDQDGIYVVDGDTPVANIKRLRDFYSEIYSAGELIVHRSGGADAVWSSTQKLNLTYCVSNTFNSNKQAVVTAMAEASAAWAAVANIKYVYVPAQDATCTASNNNVVFDVRPTSGQSYLARSFFPDQSRSTRNVIIDSSSFGNSGSWTLTGILRHELGHTLGFRHEHTRPEAGTCFEDNNWRALTAYDKKSVMHYPQCNGIDSGLVITTLDATGAKSLYGAPGGTNPPPPPPPPDDQTYTASGSLARNATKGYGPFKATTHVKAVITGTGDADLYVRFGSAPTTTQFACRPYESDSSEECDLDVPAGAGDTYVSVRGYAAATYSLTVTYH
jgi:hypothetical protein